MRRREATLALAALGGLLPTIAVAEAYPDHGLRLIVPYPPGASTDAVGRQVAQKMSESLGKNIVVENLGGASGNIGSDYVAKSKPDGYTFLLGTDATHSANMHLLANPPFDPVKDFTPLTLAAMNPIVLVVHPSVPANNLRELVAYVRANPDRGSYGSSGIGSPHHLAGELLHQRTGAAFVHVPYRGGGPALNDVMGGQIPMIFASVITVLQHIRAGKLRAIATTQTTRYEGLPDVPTMAETLEGFDMSSWLGFLGPAHLPDAVARRLSEEVIKSLNDPEVKAKLVAGGLVVVASSAASFASQIRRDFDLRGKLIEQAGIKAE